MSDSNQSITRSSGSLATPPGVRSEMRRSFAESGTDGLRYAIVRNAEPAYHKPNEDFLIADQSRGIYVICDGVTRSLDDGAYPDPSPAALVSELIAFGAYDELKRGNRLRPFECLHSAAVNANFQAGRFNESYFKSHDYLLNDKAGAVMIMAITTDTALYYAFIGDCCGYAVNQHRTNKFTSSQVIAAIDYVEREMASAEGVLAMRRDFRNNRAQSLGYGVLNGEGSALEFMVYGKIDKGFASRVLLTSDGLDPAFTPITDDLAKFSPSELITLATAREKELGIRSDDKSIVSIELR